MSVLSGSWMRVHRRRLKDNLVMSCCALHPPRVAVPPQRLQPTDRPLQQSLIGLHFLEGLPDFPLRNVERLLPLPVGSDRRPRSEEA
jgi:hypothetical protein